MYCNYKSKLSDYQPYESDGIQVQWYVYANGEDTNIKWYFEDDAVITDTRLIPYRTGEAPEPAVTPTSTGEPTATPTPKPTATPTPKPTATPPPKPPAAPPPLAKKRLLEFIRRRKLKFLVRERKSTSNYLPINTVK